MALMAETPTVERPREEAPSAGSPASAAPPADSPPAAAAPGERASDQELIRAYAEGGDRGSLGAFVLRHQASLLRFAARFLGDEDAAQDVVQETFLQVTRRPERLFGVASCHDWLLRVARNIAVSRIRRNAVAEKHAAAVRERAAAIQARAARAAGPDGPLEAEETRKAVRAAIDRLDPRAREVLLLKVQEEKSYKEIAEITGLTVTHVGYILHRAMKALASRLNHTGEAHP
mgnify:CR=1 FL=1